MWDDTMYDDTQDDWSPLHVSVDRGRMWEVSGHLASGIPVDVTASDGSTPFALAVLQYARALADERHGSRYQYPAVWWAHPEMAKARAAKFMTVLLEAGADANQKIALDHDGTVTSIHAMHFACSVGDVAMAGILLRFAVSANVKCGADTPLTLATKRRKRDLMALLLEHRANVNAFPQNCTYAALHFACHVGDLDSALVLLNAGASPNLQAQDGRRFGPTPLYLACASGNERLVMLLLQANADVNETWGDMERSALMAPLDLGFRGEGERKALQIVELLLKHGADVNAKMAFALYEHTPLSLAVRAGWTSIVDALLQAGADPNRPSGMCLPLYLAFLRNDYQMTKLLLNAGADAKDVPEY